MEAQLDVPLAELRSEVPIDPRWGVKRIQKERMSFGLATRLT